MYRQAMRRVSCVLAIGGLDPGGGAGILADARAIDAAGAFACAVAAVLTVQSTRGMRRAAPVSPALWVAQARRVLADQRVGAIKLGALGTAANVRAAAALLAANRSVPAVIDPVMAATRGARRLLEARALGAMRRDLVPRATLVTANAHEAEALTGLRVRDVGDARAAARALVAMGARAALVKGGHLGGAGAVDVLASRERIVELRASRLRLGREIHGGGCVLASLVAGRLACGDDVVEAVKFAKRVHRAAMARPVDVGGTDAAILAAR
jgi:hydroxymethylpyrimidine kinase/phosphomethylpyrimidine kinase